MENRKYEEFNVGDPIEFIWNVDSSSAQKSSEIPNSTDSVQFDFSNTHGVSNRPLLSSIELISFNLPTDEKNCSSMITIQPTHNKIHYLENVRFHDDETEEGPHLHFRQTTKNESNVIVHKDYRLHFPRGINQVTRVKKVSVDYWSASLDSQLEDALELTFEFPHLLDTGILKKWPMHLLAPNIDVCMQDVHHWKDVVYVPHSSKESMGVVSNVQCFGRTCYVRSSRIYRYLVNDDEQNPGNETKELVVDGENTLLNGYLWAEELHPHSFVKFVNHALVSVRMNMKFSLSQGGIYSFSQNIGASLMSLRDVNITYLLPTKASTWLRLTTDDMGTIATTPSRTPDFFEVTPNLYRDVDCFAQELQLCMSGFVIWSKQFVNTTIRFMGKEVPCGRWNTPQEFANALTNYPTIKVTWEQKQQKFSFTRYDSKRIFTLVIPEKLCNLLGFIRPTNSHGSHGSCGSGIELRGRSIYHSDVKLPIMGRHPVSICYDYNSKKLFYQHDQRIMFKIIDYAMVVEEIEGDASVSLTMCRLKITLEPIYAHLLSSLVGRVIVLHPINVNVHVVQHIGENVLITSSPFPISSDLTTLPDLTHFQKLVIDSAVLTPSSKHFDVEVIGEKPIGVICVGGTQRYQSSCSVRGNRTPYYVISLKHPKGDSHFHFHRNVTNQGMDNVAFDDIVLAKIISGYTTPSFPCVVTFNNGIRLKKIQMCVLDHHLNLAKLNGANWSATFRIKLANNVISSKVRRLKNVAIHE
jgi:hypothetical protein